MRRTHRSILTLLLTTTPLLALEAATPSFDPAATGPAATPAPSAQDPQKPALYDESANAEQQIQDAVTRAAKNHRRVLIQWGANWCGWCHLLQETFTGDAKVSRELLYEYDVVHIDVGRFDKNMELAAELGADFQATGIPYLTVLDSEGRPVENQPTGPLETKIDGKNAHDPEKVLAFLKEQEAPRAKAWGELHQTLANASKLDKRVFLTFGAPWCGWCHRLEDWTQRPEVQPLLAEEFLVLKIDVDRYLDGKAVMARYRPESSGGIPWFAILGQDGEAIATSEGPNGNLGCPWTDEEIAAFGELLGTATVKLGEEEIAVLTSGLVSMREEIEKARGK